MLGKTMRRIVASMGVLAAGTPALLGDEGMWLYTNPPLARLKDRYGFEPGKEWLEHLQKSSVRFNSGGSGSFVSKDGLVMTNHHVAADALQKMGTPERNYYRDGFYAKTRGEERKCEAMELNVLESIEDVTARVEGAVKGDMKPDQAAKARRAVMNAIEDEETKKTGLRSNIVTLYQGGAYHLYRFKRYTDVRLVWAPEQQIAFFGGDPDNFEFPRYCLDAAFFRVYENDKPAEIKHFLKWSANGCADGELTFVSGHPGRTNRLATVAELEYTRDIGYPYLMQRLYRMEVLLNAFSARSEENARQAKELLFSVQNSRKARLGGLGGLMDPAVMARKRAEEAKLREAAEKDPKLADAKGAWDKVAEVYKTRAKILKRHGMLEGGAAFASDLFGIARTLVRSAQERDKPQAERLREFIDSNKQPLELQLFSEEPIYEGFEILRLADSLASLSEQLGHDDPLVVKVLAGKSPVDRAAELVNGSKLKDVATRKKLYEDGLPAVTASKDPMIELALLVDPESRELRKVMENEVEEPRRQAYAQIAKVKFALEGTSTYPDATFTLRLSYGPVKGYQEAGKKVAPITTVGGLYERSKGQNNKAPFDLPPLWAKKKDSINLDTPFNFVSTADIIGGNSGSPVVNYLGEVVGLIFDGNIQSLVLDFAYSDEQARAVSVCSQVITEALRKVYDASPLADELQGK
jgi:hypothetical protein